MALTKAQASLVTVATLGVAPGGYATELQAFNTQKEAAAFIATTGLLNQGTNAEFALQVAKNLGVSAGNPAVTDFFNKLEGGASRADATVDFANAQLVAQGGNIANVEAAIASESISKDLGELGAIVADQAIKTGTTIDLSNGSKANIGKDEIDAGASKISADYTFELKDQIGENATYEGLFLSPVLGRAAAESEASTLFLKLLDGFADRDGVEPIERLTTNGFGFKLDGVQIDVVSDDIKNAKTYVELKDAVAARLAELAADTSLDPAYAKLVNFEVSLGENFTRTNQEGDAVTGTTINIKDTKGGTIEALGYSESGGIQGNTKVNIIKELTTDEPGTITKLITTNLEADNVGYGSQGATVNLAGQSASDKGVEEIKVTATNGVWFTKLESKAATNHLARIELQSGSNGYFNVGTQNKESVTSLLSENFNTGGLLDVQQVVANNASSTAINSFVSSNVLSRYDFEDTGVYTADDSQAAITYNLSSGKDVLNLAIDTQVLEAVDTQVNVNTGAGNDVITVAAVNNLGGTVEVANNGNWLVNQQLNNNITINAGDGNDWILTPGAGNATINAGSGDDVVRTDNEGGKAVFVFNNATTDLNALISNSDKAHSAGANQVDQTYNNLFKATVKVSFKGFESKAIVIESTNFTTNTKQVNQAIKAAVNNDPVLSKLLKAHDNAGNALGIESLIDGGLSESNLNIQVVAPAAYNENETADQMAARKAAGQEMLGKDDLLNATKVTDPKATTATVTANDLNSAATSLNGIYSTEFATVNGALLNGFNSFAESDNVIDLGAGSDLLVMGTGANSNDTLVLKGYNNGTNTVVNFDVSNGAGRDFLDLSAYVGKGQSQVTPSAVNNASGTLADKAVAKTSVTAAEFANLTNAEIVAQLNGTAATDKQITGLESINATANTTANSNYVLMVENADNAGEFKVFHLTANSGANEGKFANAQTVATLDFGDLTATTSPSVPANPVVITIAADVANVAGTDAEDIFTVPAGQTFGDLTTVNITDFGAGDKIDLSGAYANGFDLGVLTSDSIGQPVDIAVEEGGLTITLMNAPNLDNIDTWQVKVSGEAIAADVLTAVEGAADGQAALNGVNAILGEGWFEFA